MNARVLTVIVVSAAGAFPAQDLTLDQILAKNEDAVGGIDAIKRTQTIRLTTSTALGGDPARVTMTITVKRPNLTRIDTVSQGRTVASGFDGSTAWVTDPATGVAQPMNLDKTASGNLSSFQIDGILGSLTGILVGQKNQLVGTETIQGGNAYDIKAARSDGLVSDYFVDQTTFLIVKSAAQIPQDSGTQTVEGYPTDYRKVNGMTLSYSLDVKLAGQSVYQMQVQKFEINPPIDNGIFKMPSAPVR